MGDGFWCPKCGHARHIGACMLPEPTDTRLCHCDGIVADPALPFPVAGVKDLLPNAVLPPADAWTEIEALRKRLAHLEDVVLSRTEEETKTLKLANELVNEPESQLPEGVMSTDISTTPGLGIVRRWATREYVRDVFAAQAMMGLLANPNRDADGASARDAYAMADAMLAARETKGEAKADAWAQVNAGLDAIVKSGWMTPPTATAEAIAAAVEKAVGEERKRVQSFVDAEHRSCADDWCTTCSMLARLEAKLARGWA